MQSIPFLPHAAITRALAIGASAMVVVAAAACRAAEGTADIPAHVPASRIPATNVAAVPASTAAPLSAADAEAAVGPDRCAELLRSPRATQMAAVQARFDTPDAGGPAAPTPERLVHLRYTFDSQSEQALATYLQQWHDATAPIDAPTFAALSPAEQAVYSVFGSPLPVGRPAPDSMISDGVGPDDPPPSQYTILPMAMYVACADRLYDPAADQWSNPLETSPSSTSAYAVLGDFRPAPPEGSGTALYLREEESLAIHHLLGSTPVYDPPLGSLSIPGVGYPDDSTRLEWLRRAIPIARTFSGALQLQTMPAIRSITLDRTLEHAIVDVRIDASSSGSYGLVKTPGSERNGAGGDWTVAASFGGGVE